MSEAIIRAPFPYFGGKAKAADLIWSRLGTDCGNYVEPFFGSGAVWLNRPAAYAGWCTVNDLDGNVANFWRAVTADPDAVAEAADWPVIEYDLTARHLWLVQTAAERRERLQADPDWYDARAAGWWAWGACSWIGSGWCEGTGPYKGDGDAGTSVNRQLPHLGDAGRGVNRQLPHLWRGVGVQSPQLSERAERRAYILGLMRTMQDRMVGARVACGDWARVCSVGTMTRNGIAAVLMDPPYSQTGAVYAEDSATVSRAVRAWCETHGGNKQLRIALCGHAGEHESLEAVEWSVSTWDKSGGYQGADDRERIWFSPHCLTEKQQRLF